MLPLLPELPLFLIGYSGGFALAACGPHRHDRCIGLGGLGADAVPAGLEEGPAWRAPVKLNYNTQDRVFAANRQAVDELVEEGLARCWRSTPGGHPMADYLSNGCWRGMILHADRLRTMAA